MKEEDDAKKPKPPTQSDGGIEIDWDELNPEAPTARRNLGPLPNDASPDERPTAVPPESYHNFASRLMAGMLTTEEEKRALSTPNLPKIDAATLSDRVSAFMNAEEASIPVLGERLPSGSFDIALDMVGTEASTIPFCGDNAIVTRPAVPQEPSSARDDQSLDFAELSPESDFAAPCTSLKLSSVEPENGTALDLVALHSPPSKKREAQQLIDLRDRYAVGDFSGALGVAEAILEQDPANAEVARYAESCRDILMQMYTARLGSTRVVPRVVLAPERIRWLTLDHRAGFLLSCIDGCSTVEEILDVSGMPALDSLRILCDMLHQEIINVSPRR